MNQLNIAQINEPTSRESVFKLIVSRNNSLFLLKTERSLIDCVSIHRCTTEPSKHSEKMMHRWKINVIWGLTNCQSEKITTFIYLKDSMLFCQMTRRTGEVTACASMVSTIVQDSADEDKFPIEKAWRQIFLIRFVVCFSSTRRYFCRSTYITGENLHGLFFRNLSVWRYSLFYYRFFSNLC